MVRRVTSAWCTPSRQCLTGGQIGDIDRLGIKAIHNNTRFEARVGADTITCRLLPTPADEGPSWLVDINGGVVYKSFHRLGAWYAFVGRIERAREEEQSSLIEWPEHGRPSFSKGIEIVHEADGEDPFAGWTDGEDSPEVLAFAELVRMRARVAR